MAIKVPALDPRLREDPPRGLGLGRRKKFSKGAGLSHRLGRAGQGYQPGVGDSDNQLAQHANQGILTTRHNTTR